jgi:hypothetical protein
MTTDEPLPHDAHASTTQRKGSKMDDLKALEWHMPAHRAVMASVKLGAWMSAALDDPNVCDAMKADIQEWFSAGEPMETLGQALADARGERDRIVAWLRGQCTGRLQSPIYLADAIASGAYKDTA